MHFLVYLLRLLRVCSVLIGRRRIEHLGHDGVLQWRAGIISIASDRCRNRCDRKRLLRGSKPGGPRMAKNKDGRIVETSTEARQAEPGPSILLILIVSVVLAAIFLGAVWFIFFRT